MQLGEVIATYDVASALRGESGKFEVTSPTGAIYQVNCKPDHSISNLEWSGNRTGPQPFRVRKVAEPISVEPGKEVVASMIESEPQTRPMPVPFLLESQKDDAEPSFHEDMAPASPKIPQDGLTNSEPPNLDLLYLGNDSRSDQPAAWVCLKSVQQDVVKTERFITSPCRNFNELDAEIRRLHAQLEEIRSRAKKQFYRTQAVSMGA